MAHPSFGKRSRCPTCNSLLSAAADVPFGQTHCPRCTAQLWFVNFPNAGTRFILRTRQPLTDTIALLVAPQSPELARALPAILDDAETDPLDCIELLMEVEQALPALAD